MATTLPRLVLCVALAMASPSVTAQAMEPSMPMASDAAPIPPVTDADRAAAFPAVTPHPMPDNAIHSYVLLDRLETWNGDHGANYAWEGRAWIGTDLDRLWIRGEGEYAHGEASGDVEMLYGRSIAAWWDVVAGLRADFGSGPSRTRLAFGVQGEIPGKIELDATAYAGVAAGLSARLEAEYELLLTNRLILQPRVELDFAGRADPQHGIGSGLTTAEYGLRLRYEINRHFAPYVGIVRESAYGNTARFTRAAGDDAGDTRIVAGLRLWF